VQRPRKNNAGTKNICRRGCRFFAEFPGVNMEGAFTELGDGDYKLDISVFFFPILLLILRGNTAS
jgi:hypothetical protein